MWITLWIFVIFIVDNFVDNFFCEMALCILHKGFLTAREGEFVKRLSRLAVVDCECDVDNLWKTFLVQFQIVHVV